MVARVSFGHMSPVISFLLVGFGVLWLAAIVFAIYWMVKRFGAAKSALNGQTRAGVFSEGFMQPAAAAAEAHARPEIGTHIERQASLNAALRIGEEDLAMNRSGAVSERQRQHLRRKEWTFALVWGLSGLVWGNALYGVFIEGVRSSGSAVERMLPILLYAVIFVAWVGFGVLSYLRSPLRFNGGAVQTYQGNVTRADAYVSAGKSGRRHAYYVRFLARSFEIPQGAHAAIDERKNYRLFYLEGGRGTLIGIEELT